mgnify:CR=1 FL=1
MDEEEEEEQEEEEEELQDFVEQAVAFAMEEGVGGSLPRYSYPGQAGFLQREGDKRIHLLVNQCIQITTTCQND